MCVLGTVTCAMLSVIAYAEGTNGHYDRLFGHETFLSYKAHPNKTVVKSGHSTTSAGRYQFLYSTWKELGMPDFTPDSQDIAATKLILRKCKILPETEEQFMICVKKLKRTWVSLPGGSQERVTKQEVVQVWNEYLGTSTFYVSQD